MAENKCYCTDYDYEMFFRLTKIILPEVLKIMHIKKFRFIVKGGMAVDAYVKKFSEGPIIGSPDWDLQVAGSIDAFVKTAKKLILSYQGFQDLDLVKVRIVLDVEPGHQQHGYQIGFRSSSEECGTLFFLDVFQVDEIPKSVLIDKIPYIPLRDLVVDLIKTLKNREIGLEQAESLTIPRDELRIRLEGQIEAAEIQIKKGKKGIRKIIADVGKTGEEKTTDIIEILEDIQANTENIVNKRNSLNSVDFEKSQVDLHKARKKLERTRRRLEKIISMPLGKKKLEIICQTMRDAPAFRTYCVA